MSKFVTIIKTMAITDEETPSIRTLDSVDVNYYATSSKGCQAKHSSTASRIQEYLDNLQDKLGLPRIPYVDMTDTGGSFSTDDAAITKWWYAFWEDQPSFWFNARKSNGDSYSHGTLERYMPSIKNQLSKKFLLSRYNKVIEETYAPAFTSLKTMVKDEKKASPTAPKNKVYNSEDIAFILQRCLWFNLEKYIDFFIFQTATLRLSSRGTETSRISIENISIRELCEGPRNTTLQCYLVRDKMGVDNNHPLVPNRDDLYGDLVVAIGLSLFLRGEKAVMPSIVNQPDVSAYYNQVLNSIWKRYPPVNGQSVRKGTSHFGKHTAQYLLDGCKQHVAAQLFGGWNIGKGARDDYFSNPFPYLLDGAKALAGWSKIGADYQRVAVPPYDLISKEIGDKILSVFFGHVPENLLSVQAQQMILMCLLSKWDKLIDQIREEPNGLFRDPRSHIIYGTLCQRLARDEIPLSEFNKFKSECEREFNKSNEINMTVSVASTPMVNTPPRPDAIPSVTSSEYSLTPFQEGLNIRPLKSLLDLVTRNTDPKIVFINFFALDFAESYKSTPKVDNRMRCKYRKVKAAVRVIVRFLDKFPVDSPPTLEESGIAMYRIKSALLSDAPSVKTQGKHQFNASTPLHLSIIRDNEVLLTDKSKPWYRPLPPGTPYTFIEHVYAHKIYDI